ncbi:helix-turn-helix transcriptional regulator [Pontibacter qinzhouensis]|uniref:Helix-turn-helix transcriptional regulator n=1 Tax=Pontibacter qinzhouensis TaxID=2603253 RepID=A0A5C8K6U5_9BACT|nr:helix-turn-helix transcriptional regulator [Pontibacter qinzhouensis]TXK45369.1 helix-turn-helix transcriptional regulator [Pontibacter qinzhouensis]
MKEKEQKPHLGRNLQRAREMLGLKQATFAGVLGKSQQSVSKWEQQETIPDEFLETLAAGLGVTAAFIRNFEEQKAIRHFQRSFLTPDADTDHHPMDKVAELFKLLVQAEKEKMELLTNTQKAIQDLADLVQEVKRQLPTT